MGVEDTTKTDTRTETSDKPASSERPPSPPPDNPGSPGQPSRLESLARAREQQQSRAQETQDKGTGSPPREDRDDKTTTEQTGSGKTETSGKPEAEDKQQREDKDQREDDGRPGTDKSGRQDRRDDEPRSQDQGTTAGRQADTGTPGDRDRPQTQPAEPRADTRTEPADRPASSERQWTPPPDNPGSPGQPSRLESLARAREEQERRAQQSESTDTGGRPTEQHDNQPTTAQPDNDAAKTELAGKREGAAEKQDAGNSGTDEGRTEGRPRADASEASPTPEQDARGADKPTDDGREPRPEPAGQTTDQPTGPQEPRPATTTGELEPQERATDPPRTAEQSSQTTDGPADDGNQTRPEPAEQPTAPANGTDQPHPTETQTKPGDEPTGQQPATTHDTGTHVGESGAQPTTDTTPSSPEEPEQNQETGQHDSDRDKKSEEPESTEPEGNIRPEFTPYNTPDGRTYYTVPLEELSRNRDDSTQSRELEEADAERSPYAMTFDEFTRASLNPSDASIEPGVVTKPPDRREQTENDTESRIDRARRGTWMRGGDLKDAGKALSDTANGILGPRPPAPTGRAETGTGPYIAPPDAKGATPDAFVATATAAMLAIEGTRKAKQVGSRLLDQLRGRNHDSNG